MGNFSRDTFKLTNAIHHLLTGEPVIEPRHYVGVRIQQGVPLLDADLNELDDIRRVEQQAIGMFFIGSGVPVGSDGFRIFSSAQVNDFAIEAGTILVDGTLVWNRSPTTYLTQPNSAIQQQTPPLPDLPALPTLSPPAVGDGTRHDLVYLDVWEREVTHEEDGRLKDTRVGEETSVRLLREWVVRVAEGVQPDATQVPDAIKASLPGHRVYPLARIERREDQAAIVLDDITDLRRLDLTLSQGEGAMRVYNIAGILEYDSDDFADMCRQAWTVYTDLLYSDLFLNDNFDAPTALESLTLFDAFQDVKNLSLLGETSARRGQLGNQAALSFLDDLELVQKKFHDQILPLAEASTARVLTSQFLDQLYLLLGEEPGQLTRGLRHALDDGKLREAIDAQLAINAFVAGRASILPRGRIEITYVEGPPPDELITAPGTYRFIYDVTSRLTLPDTLNLTAWVDGAPDWTVNPLAALFLEPDETSRVNVDVSIPAGTPNTSGTLVLNARSQSNPGAIDDSNNELDLTLNALPPGVVPISIRWTSPDVDVASGEIVSVGRGLPGGLPGKRVPAQFNVENMSDEDHSFTISYAFSVADVFETIPDHSPNISAGDTHIQDIILEATATSVNGTRADLTITVTSVDDPSMTKDLVVTLEVNKS